MANAKKLGIEQTNRFVNGIRKDLLAVKKVIELNYNNRLVERSINKQKVTKGILYITATVLSCLKRNCCGLN